MLLLKSSSIFILLVSVSQLVKSQGICEEEENESWSYHGRTNGPSSWGNLYPNCNVEQQSPINIVRKDVKEDPGLTKIEYVNYNEPITRYNLTNTGHTVQMTPLDGVRRCIRGGGLPGEYCLVQCHYHWGKDSSRGSEHLFDGKSYPLELHCVHADENGNLAVLAKVYKICAHRSNFPRTSVPISKSIQYKDEYAIMTRPRLYLKHILSPDDCYYRYIGSLTTPGCNEGVIWTVYRKPGCVAEKKMEQLRNLYSIERPKNGEPANENCKLVDNFRPVQPLNGRTVYSYGCQGKTRRH